MEALNRIWLSLVAYMESRPNNDDQARGLRKSLKEFKSVASLCMMMDFHSNFYEHGFTERTCRSFFSSGNGSIYYLTDIGSYHKSKNGKFLYEILPSEKDVTEINWKENTSKVNPNAV